MTPQRGMVLFIALIVMVAMSLTGAALVRSVDTTTAIVGNVGLRESSIAPAVYGLEHAIAAIYENNPIADRDHDLPARSYYASRQAGEDVRGVPLALQTPSRYPPGAPVIDAGNGNSVRYIIERLCARDGPPGVEHCNMVSAPQPLPAAAGPPTARPLMPHVALRITIRVDGPQHGVSHVQTMVRDSSPVRRIAWRILGE